MTTTTIPPVRAPEPPGAVHAPHDQEGCLVSAIVSTYNAERFIRGKLEDLEAQTIAEQLEIVVVDSGSQQNERAVVEEFQRRYGNIRYIRTGRRETVYQAWNRGIREARGEFVTNANTDDRLRRDCYQTLVQALREHPDCVLAYGDMRITRQENATFECHEPYGVRQWQEFDRNFLIEVCCIGPFPLWRRSLHDEIGYFDERYRSAADYDFWLRAALEHDFIHVPQFLGLYWLSPETVSRKGDLPALEYLQVQKEHRPEYARFAAAPATVTAQEEGSFRTLAAAASQNPEQAVAALERFAEQHPRWPQGHHDLADIYYRIGEVGYARKHYELAALADPGSPLHRERLRAFLRAELSVPLREYLAQAAAKTDDLKTQLILGMICIIMERYDAARTHYLRVLEIDPDHAPARENLAFLERCGNGGDEGAATCRTPSTGANEPQLAEPAHELFLRGNALFKANELERAAECYRRALLAEPLHAPACFNLGCAAERLNGPAQALPHFQKATLLRPEWAEARCSLGLALARTGRMEEAAAEFHAAAALRPKDAGIRNDLALALSALDRGEEAFAAFRAALRLAPLNPEPHSNLAALYERYGRSSEAISSALQALRLRPEYPEAHHNLGCALKSQGRHPEAIAHFREALRLKPGFSEARSSLLFTLCYPAGIPEDEIFAEHLSFGAAHRFAIKAHDNLPSPDRQLSIGYVSADFRDHAVARFIEPVLRHHDRSRFRIFCYSNVTVPDARSATIASLCDRFVNIAGVADAAAEQMIRQDGIDILVDLSGHSAGNRLPLFARKPAPLQVTWLGYPHSTGLDAIDYRISDGICDPPGEADRLHAEKLLRLPENFSCFAPDEDAPEVTGLPAVGRGCITFASFNNPAKITPETVALWAAALQNVPESRMLVKGYSLADRGSRERLASLFHSCGIAATRLELMGNTPCYRDHLALYGRVDIALDTYPYHGTTTTCEALWMGVPVLTLAGSTHRSRVGTSLLASLGLEELVARDPAEYAGKARSLAGDPRRLQALRKSLRGTMAASRLTDAARFTRSLEEAYRDIWGRWCADRQGVPSPQRAATTSLPLPTHPHPYPPLEGEGDAGAGPAFGGEADSGPVVEEERDPDVNWARESDPAVEGVGECAASSQAEEPARDFPLDRDCQPPFPEEDSPAPSSTGEGVAAPHRHQSGMGEEFLRQGMLDRALGEFLAALRSSGDRTALAGVEQTLKRQTNLDLREAVNRDAAKRGAVPEPGGDAAIINETLEESAEVLVAMGLVTPADLICRYLLDRGHRSASVSRTLGEVASHVGAHRNATRHFRDAISLGDTSPTTRLRRLKAEESARLTPPAPEAERYLLIKAWGYGFWSDVNHVLGQLLVAELTGRVPVVDWGGNSLFSDDPERNAFENFFQPLNGITARELAASATTFYPPKWNAANLTFPCINQSEGAWSQSSSLFSLERGEEVVVSDFHFAVNDLIGWIPPGHRLHGLNVDQLYLYLFRRYLKVLPSIEAEADRFFQAAMAGRSHLALHVRGGDKGGEDPNLQRLNLLYHPEIERYLQGTPRGRLFLMTDDREILESYLDRYGDKVAHTAAARAGSGQGVHYQRHPRRTRLGQEVLIDTLLATRCDAFVGNGLSNVSCGVAQMKEWRPGTLTLLGARLDRVRQLTLYRS